MARVAHAYYFGPDDMDVDGVSNLVRNNIYLILDYFG